MRVSTCWRGKYRESIVLLKNDSGVLPLEQVGKIAFIGVFTKTPRYQGGGSRHINSSYVASALEAARQVELNVVYAQGYDGKGTTSEELIVEGKVPRNRLKLP